MARRSCYAPLCFALLVTAGCADAPKVDWYTYVPAWGPFMERNTSGIQTPAERIDELEALAERADDMAPFEQEQTVAQLAQSLSGELDPMVRTQLIHTLAEFPGPVPAALIRTGLQDPDRDVRVACCQALGRRSDADAVSLLSGLITGDAEDEVRLAAVEALGQVEDPSAVGALAIALEDADPAMQYLAVQSMRNVSGRDFGNDVNAWRQFAAGAEPQVENQGIASSLLRWWVE